MSRSLLMLSMLLTALTLGACTSSDEETGDVAKKVEPVARPAIATPKTTDDAAWKPYLGDVVSRHQTGVTDRVYAYYLPMNSTVPTPGDPENRSQYDRQLENVTAVLTRTVLPGNMLAFGSPDSAKMADLIIAAFAGAKPDAMSGSQVLFIGSAADSPRVKDAVDKVGGKYIFVEAK
jgi:hypothetical protein